jgi:hypothetical protein
VRGIAVTQALKQPVAFTETGFYTKVNAGIPVVIDRLIETLYIFIYG